MIREFKPNGGQGGIRTHGTLSRTHAFQACALNHSATCPSGCSASLPTQKRWNGAIYTDEFRGINRYLQKYLENLAFPQENVGKESAAEQFP